MKVKDCFSVDSRVRTRLLATRCQTLAGSDDSRIARQRLRGEPGSPIAFDREFGLSGSYVHRRPIRSPALRSDNRNPRRNRRRDVGGEICSLQNFGFVSAAKESVLAESPSFAAIERDPQRFILTSTRLPKSCLHAPHLKPLPASGARRKSARQ
jgi:hypothetical protein